MSGPVAVTRTSPATGSNYSGFADPAFFPWVTHAWESVVVPNPVLFIGLLAVFEATSACCRSAAGAARSSATQL